MWGLEHAQRPGVVAEEQHKPTVISRISKYSYGVSLAVPFDRKIHHWEDRVLDPSNNTYLASNQMRWLLRRVSHEFREIRSLI